MIVVLLVTPVFGVLLFLAYANLLKKMIDKRNTKDQTKLCAILTFVFLFLFMASIILVLE